ncbi:hypothetical protein [Secundilactobacillus silagei]|uniref:hypothetical protein n=1 Tax=Secundilactobacillus silagei TaxID=1293415 RepID=UPI0020925476|nr:hypothetical protein [Secundilactobacillus silagei]
MTVETLYQSEADTVSQVNIQLDEIEKKFNDGGLLSGVSKIERNRFRSDRVSDSQNAILLFKGLDDRTH